MSIDRVTHLVLDARGPASTVADTTGQPIAKASPAVRFPSSASSHTGTLLQFARYNVAGGLAFVVDFSLLFLCTSVFGVHYLLGAAAGFLGGVVTNYVLSVRWVFDRRRIQSLALEFQMFAAIGLVGLAFNEVIMWALTDGAGFHYLNSKIAATALVSVWNFSARKYVLFS